MTDNLIIRLQNVTKVFDVKTQDVLVLKNINLEIREGEFAVVFGPSGSGKSTLLNVTLGLEPATTGTVEFLGRQLTDITTEDELADFRKHNIGIVYQQTNWIRSLNVVDNVSFPLELSGVDKLFARDKALEMLEKVGMKGWATFFPTELSAGQQQKVALARALITDPRVVIADEPTGNLDYQSGIDLMNLFTQLRDQGKTVIMVTHNPDNLRYADSIIQVFDGNIVQHVYTAGQDIEKLIEELIQKVDRNLIQHTQNVSLEDIKFMSASSKARIRPSSLIKAARGFSLLKLIRGIFQILTFSIFMAINLVQSFVTGILSLPIWGSNLREKLLRASYRVYGFIIKPFNVGYSADSISPLSLVNISVKNLLSKRTRSIITIGGMALGIGFIVFLVSIGYGLEGLVISRVASLRERLQIDVIPVVSSNLAVVDTSLQQFRDMAGVKQVLPFISLAGRINYQNSQSDVVVYGVVSDYLAAENVIPVSGTLFDSNELNIPAPSTNQGDDKPATVAGGEEEIKPVELPDQRRTAVVNDAFVTLLGLTPETAVGQSFDIELRVTGELLTDEQDQLTSLPVAYEIVAVVDDNLNAIMYVPITDTKQLGVERYSQVKIVTETEEDVPIVRNLIEFLGYRTTSVLDTVTQIEQIFSNLRLLLVIVGAIALAVASLGMFNTLTVSLLERTREVGLMKAIGMKSTEVKSLFINESVIMGVMGGGGGLLFGILLGKLVSALLSVVSVSRGSGTLDIAVVPAGMIIAILALSVVIGVITGIYPAARATKISALNALRYE